MKVSDMRRKRRACQLRQLTKRVERKLSVIVPLLKQINTIADELDKGIIHYVGVYKKGAEQ
jgi:hypothetical protein